MWKQGKCAVALGFDLDAETLWLARGLTSASPMSRGKYGAYVGMPRILNFLRERELRATFFIPGWVAQNYKPIIEAILKDGHEISHHGWLHDDPNSMSVEQEEEEFLRGIEVFKEFGVTPVGYRSPAFDLGPNTLNLLKDHNYIYDTSMMAHESPYHIMEGGKNSGVVELPVSWELDDAPYYLFTFKPAYRAGLMNPDHVVSIWQTEFDFAYRESGLYVLTLHPQITGRGHRLQALGRLMDYLAKYPDVWVASHADIATAFNEDVPEEKRLKIDLDLGWHDPY